RSISCSGCQTISCTLCSRCSEVQHRLHRERHTRTKSRPTHGFKAVRHIIGHLWIFMKLSSDPVSNKLPHDSIPIRFYDSFDGSTDLMKTTIYSTLGDRFIQRFTCDL